MINRLFRIVYRLIDKPGMTAGELADELEVSTRTIYRDVDKLSMAGIPIFCSKGKGGGISLLPDYVLDKTLLGENEKEQLLASLQALDATMANENDETLHKLQDFFGTHAADWVEIGFSNWSDSSKESAKFADFKEAILARKKLKITYVSLKGSANRTVRPVKLCFKGQAWYLYAYCELREDFRFFKLARILSYRITDIPFAPLSVGKILPTDAIPLSDAVHVKMSADPSVSYRLYDDMPTLWKPVGNRLVGELTIYDIDAFCSYILSFGSAIEIIEPAEMRTKIARTVAEMSAMYEQ